jgi:hypothetical protein
MTTLWEYFSPSFRKAEMTSTGHARDRFQLQYAGNNARV